MHCVIKKYTIVTENEDKITDKWHKNKLESSEFKRERINIHNGIIRDKGNQYKVI